MSGHISTKKNAFIRGINCFSQLVLKESSKYPLNDFAICPTSLVKCLLLTVSGSKGDTAKEVLKALNISYKQKDVEALIQSFQKKMDHSEYLIMYQMPNVLYVNANFEVKRRFLNVANDIHRSDVVTIMFGRSATAQYINRWILEKTDWMIKDMVTAEDVSNKTKMVLVCVSQFKGKWAIPFHLNNTRTGLFYKTELEIIDVPMMRSEKKFYNYAESRSLQAKILEVPFIGEQASMFFVVPNKVEGVRGLMKNMEKVLETPAMTSKLLNISVPKFRVVSKYRQKDFLQSIGILRIFREDQADMSDVAGEKGELYINEVLQGVAVEVNEKGINEFGSSVMGMPMLVPQPEKRHAQDFVIDRPFIFYVKIKKIIIFVGTVLVPMQ